MSNTRKVNMAKLASALRRERPILNWKDARRRGRKVPAGARK